MVLSLRRAFRTDLFCVHSRDSLCGGGRVPSWDL